MPIDPSLLWVMGGSSLLGLGSDIMAARQQAEAAKRQREVYERLMNPEAIAAGTRRIMMPLSGDALQNIQRQIDMQNATAGTAMGGHSNLIAARAWSEIENQRQQNAMNSYLRALSGAAGAIPQPTGRVGAFGNNLQQLAMFAALSGGGQQPTTQTQAGMGWAGGGEPRPGFQGMTNFGVQQDPYFTDPYGAGYPMSNYEGR